MNYDHPLASRKSVTKAQISKYVNYVISMDKNSKNFNHFSSFYNDDDFKDVVIKSVENDSILRLMLKLNLGISVVAKTLSKPLGNELACVDIEDNDHEVEYCIAYMKDNSNPCFNIFMKYMNL